MYSTDICLAASPRLFLLLVCATPSIHYTHLLCVLYTEGALLAPLLLQLQLLYSTCQWSLLTFPLPGGKVLYCRLLLSPCLCSFLPRVVVSCLLHTIQMHIMLMDTHAQPQTHTCWQALAHMCVVMHELSYHARTQRCSLSPSLSLSHIEDDAKGDNVKRQLFETISTHCRRRTHTHTHNHTSSWLKQDKHESSGRSHNSQPVMCVDVAIIVVP